MRRTVLALSAAFVLSTSLFTARPAAALTPHTPNSITSLSYRPGPGVGEVTVDWVEDGTYTTGFVLETGLNSFSKTDSSMPVSGRNPHLWNIPRTARSITLTADQMTEAGARVSSGNHLYFRLSAVNQDPYGNVATRYYPYLRAVLPRPVGPAENYRPMRVASFNVRTARATSDAMTWQQRAPLVAKQIVTYHPGVVTLQELGPGRADGQPGTLQGTPSQTKSLLTALDSVYGERYDLVRTTPYVAPGTPTNTQGARILYDSTKYVLRSSCPETTDGHSYSSSCSIVLPLLPYDSEELRRRAAWALFEDKATGQRFYVVSAHLDTRHSSTTATELGYDRLRGQQSAKIDDTIAAMNTDNLPVFIGGDFNSWQNNRYGNSAHDVLIDRGYYDTSAALVRKNFEYTTVNHFDTTLTPAAQGVGVRLDMIFMKGARGASYFENVMKVTDSSRPSDHNMIVTDVAPFTPWLTQSRTGVRTPAQVQPAATPNS